jgi:peptidoglycan/LPS O-acetylase OafA/YrhL
MGFSMGVAAFSEKQTGVLAENNTHASTLIAVLEETGQRRAVDSPDRLGGNDSVRKAAAVSPSKKHQGQIIGLDIVRSVAAVYVMLYHYGCWIWAGNALSGGTLGAQDHWMGSFSWPGWVGVEIFFVLSGFVIAYSAQGNTASGFAKSRITRLYPTAWICTLITLVTVGLFEGSQYWLSSVRPLVHTIAIAPWTTVWIDGSFWTLAVELSFYFIIFLLLAFRLYERLGIVMMALGASTSILAVYRCGIVAGLYGGPLGAKIMDFAQNQRYFFLLTDHGMFFALGSLIWLCLLQRVSLSRLIGAVVCTVGCLAEIYLHSSLFVSDAEQRGLSVIEGSRCHALLPMTIWALAILAIICSVSFNARVMTLVGARGARVIRYLGLMTYPLYLVHQKAGFEIISILQRRVGFSTSVFLTGSLMILSSFIIVRFLEKPVQKVFKAVLLVPSKQNASAGDHRETARERMPDLMPQPDGA